MAKRKFGEKSESLYRTEKFEVRFSREDYYFLLGISNVLRSVFNNALAARQQLFAEHLAPLYERLKSASAEEEILLRKQISVAYKEHNITLFDQINELTAKRASDREFAAVPRNWQEETLDMLEGAYKSFAALRKKGDPDARPPRLRDEGFFQKIPGRYGFKVEDRKIILSCGSGKKISFLVPDYQWGKLAGAKAFKKFELYRDEPNLTKPGRFWISVAYELPAPEVISFDRQAVVYLALGASSIGVKSPRGEEVLPIWRSDKYWIPQIEEVKKIVDGRVKGSVRRNRAYAALRKKQIVSARQRVQDERELVKYLVQSHGVHFVVTEMVVRSKDGKLADSQKPERGGNLGLNWSAQNTGSLSRLVLELEKKVREVGGSVRKHKLVLDSPPPTIGAENKIWMTEKLQRDFLKEEPSVV